MRITMMITVAASAALAWGVSVADAPGSPSFVSHGGRMMVFPADSLDLSSMTFVIDGDTVSRDCFMKLDRMAIRTLTVIPSPANLIEVETRGAALEPLPADTLPGEIVYAVDGKVVDRRVFDRVSPAAIRSLTVRKGSPLRMEIVTIAAPVSGK